MTKEEYTGLYNYYYRLPTSKLEKAIGALYSRRFEEQDISAYTEHRIATRVLLEKTHTNEPLPFHLKKYQPKKLVL